MDTYSTVRNVIAEMLVIPDVNSPSLGTNSNDDVGAENPACSQHPSRFGCLSTKCVLPRFTCHWYPNYTILGVSTWTAPLLKGRKALVLMLGCLPSRLVTSPAGRCASWVWAETRAHPGPRSCWGLCCSFACGRWTGWPAAWQQLWNGRSNPRMKQSWKRPTWCSYFWITQNPTVHI